MAGHLDGSTALVTGAARGIGRAVALRLAQDGARVVVHHRDAADDPAETLAAIAACGGQALALAAELVEPAAIEALFARIDAAGLPPLRILVNNAGINEDPGFEAIQLAGLDRHWHVNARAPFLCAQHAAKRLTSGGRIVNLSSVVARQAYGGITAYAMTKGAIDSFTLHLAQILGPRGVTVNAVAPGATRTAMSLWMEEPDGPARAHASQALQRLGEAMDVARVVAFLCGPDGAWVTGQVIEAAGGWRL